MMSGPFTLVQIKSLIIIIKKMMCHMQLSAARLHRGGPSTLGTHILSAKTHYCLIIKSKSISGTF